MSTRHHIPAARKRQSVPPAKAQPAIRPFKAIEAELARLAPKCRQAQAPLQELADRVSKLTKERDAHPDTLATKLADMRLGTEITASSIRERELGAVLLRTADEIERAREVAEIVSQALEGMELPGISGMANVVQAYVDDPLCECVDRLRAAVKNARVQGSHIVVTEPTGDNAEDAS